MSTVRFVDSAATYSTGLTWNDAYESLNAAMAASSGGDIIYVDDGHSEGHTSTDLTLVPGVTSSSTNPVVVIAADKTSCSDPNTAGGSLTNLAYSPRTSEITGANIKAVTAGKDIVFAGYLKFYGLVFESIEDIYSNSQGDFYFEDCTFYFSDGTTGQQLTISTQDEQKWRFHKCVFRFTNTSSPQGRVSGGNFFHFSECTFSTTGTRVDHLFSGGYTNGGGTVIIENCDFTGFATTSSALVSGMQTGISGTPWLFLLSNVQLATNMDVVASGVLDEPSSRFECFNCSNDGTKDKIFIKDLFGEISDSRTIYNDATFDGTTSYSLKFVAGGYSIEYHAPLRFMIAEVYASANQKFTVQVVTDNVALDNDECWVDVVYPISGGGNTAAITSSKASTPLTAPSALTTTGAVFATTTGLSTPLKQKIDVTVSGGAAGVHQVWMNVAKATGVTVYVDPHVTVVAP